MNFTLNLLFQYSNLNLTCSIGWYGKRTCPCLLDLLTLEQAHYLECWKSRFNKVYIQKLVSKKTLLTRPLHWLTEALKARSGQPEVSNIWNSFIFLKIAIQTDLNWIQREMISCAIFLARSLASSFPKMVKISPSNRTVAPLFRLISCTG